MKLSVTRPGFKTVIDSLSGVAEKKSSLPGLTCLRLRTEGGLLEVHATDLEVRKILRIDAEIGEHGEALIPAGILRTVVAAAGRERVELEGLPGNRVELRAGEYLVKVAGYPVDYFPSRDDDESPEGTEIEAIDLQDLVSACVHAASRDETKLHLGGVRLLSRKDIVIAVATDGNRISLAGKRLTSAAAFETGITIPLKGVEEILRLEHAPVYFGRTDREISLIQGGADVFVRLIDAEYPDFTKAIPSECANMATVDGRELLAAVKRVAIFAKNDGVRLSCQKKFILLSAGNGDNEATDSVECTLHGKPQDLRFNARYLVDALASLPEGDFFLKYDDPGSPCVIIPGNMAGWDERLCVLGQMRL